MNTSWMKARQTQYGAYLFVYVIVVVGVLFAANWLAKDHNKSFDLTANKRFTLSDQTTKVVTGLSKPIDIYYFDKADSYESARDTLNRYKNLNTSKINLKYVDPEKDPVTARSKGARAFGDIVIDGGGKTVTAKSLTEAELTGAIIKALKTGDRNVCFLQGEGEHALDDTSREGYTRFKDALERSNYQTKGISLLEKAEIPSDCTIVVVGGPRHDLLQPALDALKNYVAAGGKLLVNLDGVVNFSDGSLGDTPELAKLLETWGITANKDLIVETGPTVQLFGEMTALVTTYEQHPIAKVMTGNASLFPLSRSLDVKAPAEKLFSSGGASYSIANAKDGMRLNPDKDKKGPFVLGAAATIGSGKTAGRVVVIGSANWADNEMVGAPVANRGLLVNVFNWLSLDEDLISIPSKEPEDRRLRVTSTAPFFWICLVLLPLAVIFSGVSVWWKRR